MSLPQRVKRYTKHLSKLVLDVTVNMYNVCPSNNVCLGVSEPIKDVHTLERISRTP